MADNVSKASAEVLLASGAVIRHNSATIGHRAGNVLQAAGVPVIAGAELLVKTCRIIWKSIFRLPVFSRHALQTSWAGLKDVIGAQWLFFNPGLAL